MNRIIVTVHDEFMIAYADTLPIDNFDLHVQYIQSIYLDYYDTKFPMYAFLRQHTFVLYPISMNLSEVSILEHAKIFSDFKFPLRVPGTHNIHRFKFDDEGTLYEADQTFNKFSKPHLVKRLEESLQRYGSDIYRIFVPFDILYCDPNDLEEMEVVKECTNADSPLLYPVE